MNQFKRFHVQILLKMNFDRYVKTATLSRVTGRHLVNAGKTGGVWVVHERWLEDSAVALWCEGSWKLKLNVFYYFLNFQRFGRLTKPNKNRKSMVISLFYLHFYRLSYLHLFHILICLSYVSLFYFSLFLISCVVVPHIEHYKASKFSYACQLCQPLFICFWTLFSNDILKFLIDLQK